VVGFALDVTATVVAVVPPTVTAPVAVAAL
jgi:hypothetical protein